MKLNSSIGKRLLAAFLALTVVFTSVDTSVIKISAEGNGSKTSESEGNKSSNGVGRGKNYGGGFILVPFVTYDSIRRATKAGFTKSDFKPIRDAFGYGKSYYSDVYRIHNSKRVKGKKGNNSEDLSSTTIDIKPSYEILGSNSKIFKTMQEGYYTVVMTTGGSQSGCALSNNGSNIIISSNQNKTITKVYSKKHTKNRRQWYTYKQFKNLANKINHETGRSDSVDLFENIEEDKYNFTGNMFNASCRTNFKNKLALFNHAFGTVTKSKQAKGYHGKLLQALFTKCTASGSTTILGDSNIFTNSKVKDKGIFQYVDVMVIPISLCGQNNKKLLAANWLTASYNIKNNLTQASGSSKCTGGYQYRSYFNGKAPFANCHFGMKAGDVTGTPAYINIGGAFRCNSFTYFSANYDDNNNKDIVLDETNFTCLGKKSNADFYNKGAGYFWYEATKPNDGVTKNDSIAMASSTVSSIDDNTVDTNNTESVTGLSTINMFVKQGDLKVNDNITLSASKKKVGVRRSIKQLITHAEGDACSSSIYATDGVEFTKIHSNKTGSSTYWGLLTDNSKTGDADKAKSVLGSLGFSNISDKFNDINSYSDMTNKSESSKLRFDSKTRNELLSIDDKTANISVYAIKNTSINTIYPHVNLTLNYISKSINEKVKTAAIENTKIKGLFVDRDVTSDGTIGFGKTIDYKLDNNVNVSSALNSLNKQITDEDTSAYKDEDLGDDTSEDITYKFAKSVRNDSTLVTQNTLFDMSILDYAASDDADTYANNLNIRGIFSGDLISQKAGSLQYGDNIDLNNDSNYYSTALRTRCDSYVAYALRHSWSDNGDSTVHGEYGITNDSADEGGYNDTLNTASWQDVTVNKKHKVKLHFGDAYESKKSMLDKGQSTDTTSSSDLAESLSDSNEYGKYSNAEYHVIDSNHIAIKIDGGATTENVKFNGKSYNVNFGTKYKIYELTGLSTSTDSEDANDDETNDESEDVADVGSKDSNVYELKDSATYLYINPIYKSMEINTKYFVNKSETELLTYQYNYSEDKDGNCNIHYAFYDWNKDINDSKGGYENIKSDGTVDNSNTTSYKLAYQYKANNIWDDFAWQSCKVAGFNNKSKCIAIVPDSEADNFGSYDSEESPDLDELNMDNQYTINVHNFYKLTYVESDMSDKIIDIKYDNNSDKATISKVNNPLVFSYNGEEGTQKDGVKSNSLIYPVSDVSTINYKVSDSDVDCYDYYFVAVPQKSDLGKRGNKKSLNSDVYTALNDANSNNRLSTYDSIENVLRKVNNNSDVYVFKYTAEDVNQGISVGCTKFDENTQGYSIIPIRVQSNKNNDNELKYVLKEYQLNHVYRSLYNTEDTINPENEKLKVKNNTVYTQLVNLSIGTPIAGNSLADSHYVLYDEQMEDRKDPMRDYYTLHKGSVNLKLVSSVTTQTNAELYNKLNYEYTFITPVVGTNIANNNLSYGSFRNGSFGFVLQNGVIDFGMNLKRVYLENNKKQLMESVSGLSSYNGDYMSYLKNDLHLSYGNKLDGSIVQSTNAKYKDTLKVFELTDSIELDTKSTSVGFRTCDNTGVMLASYNPDMPVLGNSNLNLYTKFNNFIRDITTLYPFIDNTRGTVTNSAKYNLKAYVKQYIPKKVDKGTVGESKVVKTSIDVAKSKYVLTFRQKNDSVTLKYLPEVRMTYDAVATNGVGLDKMSTPTSASNNIGTYMIKVLAHTYRYSETASMYIAKLDMGLDLDNKGKVYSTGMATGSRADKLSKTKSTGKSLPVIYAGSDITVSTKAGEAKIDMYGYALDLVSKKQDSWNDSYSEGSQKYIVDRDGNSSTTEVDKLNYDDIVSDNSDVSSEWGNNELTNAQELERDFKTWVSNMTDEKSYEITGRMEILGARGTKKYNHLNFNYSTSNRVNIVREYNYPIYIRHGKIVKVDSDGDCNKNNVSRQDYVNGKYDARGYIAMINQIAKDSSTSDNKVSYEEAEEMFEKSDIYRGILNAIESDTSSRNNSDNNKLQPTNYGNGVPIDKQEGYNENHWYDEEVKTLVVRRYVADGFKLGGDLICEDKVDINAANLAGGNPAKEADWKGSIGKIFLEMRFTENSPVYNSLYNNDPNTVIILKNKELEGARFIVPNATTEDMNY